MSMAGSLSKANREADSLLQEREERDEDALTCLRLVGNKQYVYIDTHIYI